MKKICFLLIILLHFSITSSLLIAQDTTPRDSLEKLLYSNYEKDLPPEQNLEILLKLYNITKIKEPYLALEYAGQALQIARTNKDKYTQALWNSYIGDIYFRQKVYYLAMQSYFDAYTLFMEINDKEKTAYSLINIGKTYYIQNIDDLAYTYFTKADSIFSEINNKRGVIEALLNIGNVRMNSYEYDDAINDFDRAISISIEIGDTLLKAKSFYYLAKAYALIEDFDNAQKYYLKAIETYTQAGDMLNTAECYFEIADILKNKQDFDKALYYFNKSLKMFDELKMLIPKAEIYNKLADIYMADKKYDKAESLAMKALEIANLNEELEVKANAYNTLSKIYISKKQYKKALEYKDRLIQVKDSIFDERQQEQFSELQVSLETQNKEKELALKEKELKQKQLESYLMFGAIIFFLIFAIYYFRTSRKLTKVNSLLTKQNEEIKLHKEEIEKQAAILEKANNAIMQQKEEIEIKNLRITSSINYASRIQRSMLAKISSFEKKFDDSFVLFMPKEIVSGDFYWFAEVKESKPSLFKANKNDESKIIVAVVDCTGHGVPGAFMSMIGDAYLNQITKIQHIIEPDEILAELNKAIRTALHQDESANNDGMDMAICVIDKAEKTIKYAGAKIPLVYIQNDKLHRIKGDLASIGGFLTEHDRKFKKHIININEPTIIYLFSDGFQDQFGGNEQRKYMARPFREFLFKIHKYPMQTQKQMLIDEHNNWRKNHPQMDDITIVGIKL